MYPTTGSGLEDRGDEGDRRGGGDRGDREDEGDRRGGATSDSKIAAVLAQVDQCRLDYTKGLFLQVGFAPLEAMIRACIVYYALVGEFTIGHEATKLSDYLK